MEQVNQFKSVCVFCGSSTGEPAIYSEVAKELGIYFAQQNITLVYGGAKVGLMGIIADEVLNNGGKAIGVIPRFFSAKEIAHDNLTELIFVDSMAERKKVLADISDAFIALPGGFGTLDELFEMMTSSQLDIHRKPVGILNINHYYDHLIKQVDFMVTEKFMRPIHRQMMVDDSSIDGLFDKMRTYEAPVQEKWINRIKEN